LKTGERIRFMTRTKGGGRGHVGDLVVLDEAMILPESMIGALMPTLSARSVLGNPQLWYFGTAVDQAINDNGVVFARIRDRGKRGGDPSLAYFEWSFDAENLWDVTPQMAADPAQWQKANPALGIRISEEHIANELRSMDMRTFCVERGGAGDWPSLDGGGCDRS
jgi:phage terminase large subunit-like protein